MNINQINEKALQYKQDMVAFLRDMVAIPSTSQNEKDVVLRVKEEMEKCGFDEVIIDGFGNILGRIGTGSTVIAMDAHLDTVDVGNPDLWEVDPFKGDYRDGVIYGRGASDQEAGMASMVYAGKIIKELGLEEDYTLYVVGSVMEEDCDGLCWQYLLKENVIKPDVVVITEPTNLGIYRGHRGRMEMRVKTVGLSCHASAPERGENAIYKMTPIIMEIERLNEQLKDDPFLGKGTIAVTQIFFKSPSQNAVADECVIQLDRRLTAGETKESAVEELEEIFKKTGVDAQVEILQYSEKTYTGLLYPTEKYYPTWVFPEDSEVVQKAKKTFETLFNTPARIDKWTFSTNGIATAGMFGIPTVGFGPANEIYAHSPKDQCPDDHLVKAAAFYAAFPHFYITD
jgi:putative selenium metabolism hydrolase